MSRLLNLNFHILFKSLLFRISITFSVFYAVFLNISRFMKIKNIPDISSVLLNNKSSHADCFTFSGAMLIIFISALITGSFIGSEYSEGTIRNSFIAGHSRKDIYLSNFIVCASGSVILLLSYILTSLISGIILLESPQLEISRLIFSCLIQCLSIVGFSAILVFISMLVHSKSTSSAVLLITTGLMLCLAMSTTTTLNEPEHFTNHSIVYTEDETGNEKYGTFQQENPRYVSGPARTTLIQLNNILPVNQIYRVYLNISKSTNENFGVMAVYSGLIILIVNFAGISLFKRKDLK